MLGDQQGFTGFVGGPAGFHRLCWGSRRFPQVLVGEQKVFIGFGAESSRVAKALVGIAAGFPRMGRVAEFRRFWRK